MIVAQNRIDALRLLRDPRQLGEQRRRSSATPAPRSGEVGIYSEFSFEGAMIAINIVDGAATGICVVNFNDGGRVAVVNGNIVRNLTGVGPYPPDPPGFGVGIAIEADTSATGNVIDGAPRFGMLLGWGPFLRDVAATGNVIRRAPVGVAVSVVEGTGSARDQRQPDLGRQQGRDRRHALGGDRVGRPRQDRRARNSRNLLIERNRVS